MQILGVLGDTQNPSKNPSVPSGFAVGARVNFRPGGRGRPCRLPAARQESFVRLGAYPTHKHNPKGSIKPPITKNSNGKLSPPHKQTTHGTANTPHKQNPKAKLSPPVSKTQVARLTSP